MPKIIENLRETLLTEARRQVTEHGYAGTTVRSVAEVCGVGVGTVYNYFPSKDMLIATFMAEEWRESLAVMRKNTENSTEPEAVIRCIHEELCRYSARHATLFQDPNAHKTFAAVFTERHAMLRRQLADILSPVCRQCARNPSAFLPEFIAESLLTWTTANRPFEDVYSIIRQLFQ